MAPLAGESDWPSQAVWIGGEDQLLIPFAPRFFLNEHDALQRYRPVRVVRLLTVLLSAVALLFVYLTALEATSSHVGGLLALGLVAFLPQWTFRSGSISNDTVLATFSAATTWLTVRLLRRGFSWRVGAGAAVAFAAAYLTKISAVCLGPPLALAILLDRRPWRARVGHLSVLLLAGVLVLPWSLWNLALYGDIFASGAMRAVVPGLMDPKSITSPFFWTTLPYWLSCSFVGVFGWMNVWLPSWIYTAWFCVAGVSAAGLALALGGTAVALIATSAPSAASAGGRPDDAWRQ